MCRREEPIIDGWIIAPPPLAEPESLSHFESLGHPLFQHSLDDADLTDVEEEDEEEEEEEEKKEMHFVENEQLVDILNEAYPKIRGKLNLSRFAVLSI